MRPPPQKKGTVQFGSRTQKTHREPPDPRKGRQRKIGLKTKIKSSFLQVKCGLRVKFKPRTQLQDPSKSTERCKTVFRDLLLQTIGLLRILKVFFHRILTVIPRFRGACPQTTMVQGVCLIERILSFDTEETYKVFFKKNYTNLYEKEQKQLKMRGGFLAPKLTVRKKEEKAIHLSASIGHF